MTKGPTEVARKNSERGPKNVKAKLLKSACHLLSKRGPKAVTIRDIAEHAGVNHGQIHHYYGSKRKLLTAAIRHLANEHAEHAEQRGMNTYDAPPPLSLADDQQYILSVIRSVMDGDLELATLELEDDISVPRHVLENLTEKLGYDTPTAEIKAAVLTSMAIENAWAGLKDYLLTMVDAKDHEVEEISRIVAQHSRELITKLKKNKPQ